MAKSGRKYIEVRQKIDPQKKYSFDDAIVLVLDNAYAKFDESIDVALRLGVDPRHADQQVRDTVMLP